MTAPISSSRLQPRSRNNSGFALARILAVTLATALAGCPASPMPGTPCSGDTECGIGAFCADGTCTFECRIDEDCMGGTRCSARGRCVVSGDAGAPPDARPDGAVDACRTDGDCDDGLYCNGAEACRPGSSPRGCVAGPPPCAIGATCDESADACRTTCDEDADGNGRMDADNDGDSHRSAACGGDDCDDADADRFPRGGAEVCDPTAPAHDEDCNPCTIASFIGADGDRDDDGYVDVGCTNPLLPGDDPTTFACPVSIAPYVTVDAGGAVVGGTDCDDDPSTGANVHPTEGETCNGVDDDCNGNVDEGVMPTWYRDSDGDTYGSEVDGVSNDCVMPAGYSSRADDCNPTRADVNPGALDVCDAAMVSEDCDATPNEGCMCVAGSTTSCALPYPNCPAANRTCVMSASGGSSFGACSTTPATISCYSDSDYDGYAPSGASASTACTSCPSGTTSRSPGTPSSTDCNDMPSPAAGPGVYPGAPELCNSYDDDCDGTINEIGGSIVCNGGTSSCLVCGNSFLATPITQSTRSCNTSTCNWNTCNVTNNLWNEPGILGPSGLSGTPYPTSCPGSSSSSGVAVPYATRSYECGAGTVFGWLPQGEYEVDVWNYDTAVYYTPQLRVSGYDYLSGSSAGTALPSATGSPQFGNLGAGWERHNGVYRFTVNTCRVVILMITEVPHGGYSGGNTVRFAAIRKIG